MKTITIHKIDAHRRICISKDLNELELWIQALEIFNEELDHINILEKQLIKTSSISIAIKAMRRKSILMMASLCKYEQELKTEHEYGKTEYNELRLKSHLQRRQNYSSFLKEQNTFKNQIYTQLKKYKSR